MRLLITAGGFRFNPAKERLVALPGILIRFSKYYSLRAMHLPGNKLFGIKIHELTYMYRHFVSAAKAVLRNIIAKRYSYWMVTKGMTASVILAPVLLILPQFCFNVSPKRHIKYIK